MNESNPRGSRKDGGLTSPQTAVKPPMPSPEAEGGGIPPAPGTSTPEGWPPVRPDVVPPYAGAAVAVPSRIAEEIRKQNEQEERERIEKLAGLGLVERLALSLSQVWAHKGNLILGGVVVTFFGVLAPAALNKRIAAAAGGHIAVETLLAVGVDLIGYICMVGFARLVSRILDEGDPDSTLELLLSPWLELGRLWLPLLFWVGVLNMTRILGLVVGGPVLASILLAALLPLGYCYVFYLAETDDHTPQEGIVEPWNIFLANPLGWLSILPVFILTLVVAAATIKLASLFLIIFLIGLIIMFAAIVGSAFFVVSYTMIYAGYIYKQIAAQQELDGGD